VTEDSRQGLIQIKGISRSMITRKFLGVDAIFVTGYISAQTPAKRDSEAAEQNGWTMEIFGGFI
jgi:hypothetical protein